MPAQHAFDLERFVAAQGGGVFERALAELRSARKQSHWMWFVFPQLTGLGHSEVAKYYGITGLAEARAYLAHPVLGARLQECAATLDALDSRHSAADIFGFPDNLKLRSSLTLFAHAAGPESIFERLLEKYSNGERDELTVTMLRMHGTT